MLLAGGVHDATSSASWSWPPCSGPLAARGAGVGVLMGSAYLFTAEAVGTAAPSTSGYQQAAVGCAAIGFRSERRPVTPPGA